MKLSRKLAHLAPAWQLVVMFGAWMVPFFLRDAWCESLSDVKSFAEYYFAWGVIDVAALCITLRLQSNSRWWRLRYWSKYAIVCGVYTCLSGLLIYLTILGESAGYLAHFGGDGCGSFVLLYTPMAVLYWIAGGVIGGFMATWRKWLTR